MLLLLLLIIELQPVHALHAVDSLNVKHELRLKKKSKFLSCRHFQTMFLGLPLENRVLLFA